MAAPDVLGTTPPSQLQSTQQPAAEVHSAHRVALPVWLSQAVSCVHFHCPQYYTHGLSAIFPCTPVAHTSTFLHLQPAASCLSERCDPVSSIFQVLPFPSLTRHLIPCLQYLSFSPPCTCYFPSCSPGCLCHSGQSLLISLLADQVCEAQSCKAASLPVDYQDTDWSLPQAPIAAFC